MTKYNVLNFGAKGDGKTDDRAAIQQAIDACSESGGGRVVLEAGKVFYSASIQLKPHVDLHIEKGAMLKASSDIKSYIRPNAEIVTDATRRVGNPVLGKPSFVFVYAHSADHISITGEGIIDGNGFSFVERVDKYYVTGDFYPRPTMVYVENCNHISFLNICMQNAPFWTLHPAGCDDVLIQNIRILNDLDVANSDGIDPDHCSNVRILGCHIVCADDCICLKNTIGNTEYDHCKNIIISDCTLVSTSAAIKIGTEGVGNFENILVSNCIISRSNRGISLQIRDGGCVRNVSFENIIIETRRFADYWWGCGEAIAITSIDRDENTVSGSIENVRFRNITTKGENGILLYAYKKDSIRNISFENVDVCLESTSSWPKGMYDLRPGMTAVEILETKTAPVYAYGVKELTFEKLSTSVKDSQLFASDVAIFNCDLVKINE